MMIKKLSIALSVIAALGLAASAPVDAKPKAVVHVNKKVTVHVNKNVGVRVRVKKNVVVKPVVRTNRVYVVGRSYNGRVWVGRNRYFWRGQWWDYGVGRCWILVDGVWFWNPLVCPL
jgi:hypothetical protein